MGETTKEKSLDTMEDKKVEVVGIWMERQIAVHCMHCNLPFKNHQVQRPQLQQLSHISTQVIRPYLLF